jgi:hypothetical protein
MSKRRKNERKDEEPVKRTEGGQKYKRTENG